MSDTVHILISQHFLPGGGGVEVTMDQIAKQIKERNLGEVEIVCLQTTNDADTKKFDKTYIFPIYRSKSPLVRPLINLQKNFDSLVGEEKKSNLLGKFSMVIVGLLSTILLFHNSFKRIKSNRGKKITITCFSLSSLLVSDILANIFFKNEHINILFNNGFIYKKSNFFIADIICKKILRDADYILCISEASTQSLINNFKINKNKISSYHYWIEQHNNLPEINERTLGKYQGKIKILFVGRIVPQKGIAEIINLSNYIIDNNLSTKYEITVIGDSKHPIIDELINASDKSSILNYLGRINQPELWEFYLKNDVFLMPSIWKEGAGNVILEAYWHGIPVVGSNKGGIPENLINFSYYSLLSEFDPATILREIDKLYKQVKNHGKIDVFRLLNSEVKNKYSKENFKIHELIYKRFSAL